jgi:hypothetical protein
MTKYPDSSNTHSYGQFSLDRSYLGLVEDKLVEIITFYLEFRNVRAQALKVIHFCEPGDEAAYFADIHVSTEVFLQNCGNLVTTQDEAGPDMTSHEKKNCALQVFLERIVDVRHVHSKAIV